MVLYFIQWDLPDQQANLTIYANKAKNDWSSLGPLEIFPRNAYPRRQVGDRPQTVINL